MAVAGGEEQTKLTDVGIETRKKETESFILHSSRQYDESERVLEKINSPYLLAAKS